MECSLWALQWLWWIFICSPCHSLSWKECEEKSPQHAHKGLNDLKTLSSLLMSCWPNSHCHSLCLDKMFAGSLLLPWVVRTQQSMWHFYICFLVEWHQRMLSVISGAICKCEVSGWAPWVGHFHNPSFLSQSKGTLLIICDADSLTKPSTGEDYAACLIHHSPCVVGLYK